MKIFKLLLFFVGTFLIVNAETTRDPVPNPALVNSSALSTELSIRNLELNDFRLILKEAKKRDYVIVFVHDSGKGFHKYIKRVNASVATKFAKTYPNQTFSTITLDRAELKGDLYGAIKDSATITSFGQVIFYDHGIKVFDTTEEGQKIDLAAFVTPKKFLKRTQLIFNLPDAGKGFKKSLIKKYRKSSEPSKIKDEAENLFSKKINKVRSRKAKDKKN